MGPIKPVRLQDGLGGLNNLVHSHAELLENDISWRRKPEALNRHHLSVETNVLVEGRRNTCLNRHALAAADWKYFLFVGLRLAVENLASAIEIERTIQEDDPYAWLHKSCKPLGTVEFAKEQDGLFDGYCDSGVCFV